MQHLISACPGMTAAGAQWHDCVLIPRPPGPTLGADTTLQEGPCCGGKSSHEPCSPGEKEGLGGGAPQEIPLLFPWDCTKEVSLGAPGAHRCVGGIVLKVGQKVPRSIPQHRPRPPRAARGTEGRNLVCELWPRPAKVSAINRSIIKGGCTLAFEHTPDRAYFNFPRQVCGVNKGGGPAMRLQGDEGWIAEENGGSRGGGQASCWIRDMWEAASWGNHRGPRRRGLQAFAAAHQIIAMISRVI